MWRSSWGLRWGNGRRQAGKSPWASSVFLTLEPSDNRVTLRWTKDVPWNNTAFVIHRRKPFQTQFDSIATIDSLYFVDRDLVNGEQYCYYVETIGSYEINTVDSPLVNLSQINCTVPIDNIPPCAPSFILTGSCEFEELNLRWASTSTDCDSDVVGFRIYRSITLNKDFELIEEIDDPAVNTYSKKGSIAGCYYVAAIDSAGNESVFSNQECIDYCPIYELPNVMTPNGDGINDLFVPKPGYRYVDSVDFQVYNRWDQLIFKTSDPALNWNGENSESKELVSDGIYFFICQVFERSLEGPKRRVLKGTISIIDSKEAQNFK